MTSGWGWSQKNQLSRLQCEFVRKMRSGGGAIVELILHGNNNFL